MDQLVERIKREEQFPQASELVQSINEMQSAERDNTELWKNVFKTDERFTTAFSVNGGGTSINGTYMTMIATREFGPKGIGWGVDILEERFDNGAPITRTVKGTDGNNTWELIPDGVLTENITLSKSDFGTSAIVYAVRRFLSGVPHIFTAANMALFVMVKQQKITD